MPAVYIDLGICFAQPIALALLVGWRAWLWSVDPIQDPQPRKRDYVIQVIERPREESLIGHVLF